MKKLTKFLGLGVGLACAAITSLIDDKKQNEAITEAVNKKFDEINSQKNNNDEK